MDEDRLLPANERDVGPAGQILAVQAVAAQTCRSKRLTYDQFWLRIFGAYRAHIRATSARC